MQCYVILQYYNITYKFTPLTLVASAPAVSEQLVIIIISMPTLHLDSNSETFESETKIKFSSTLRSSYLFNFVSFVPDTKFVLPLQEWDYNDSQIPMT